MQLYELAAQYQDIERQLTELYEQDVIDEQTVNDTLAGIEGEFNQKAESIAMMIKNLESAELAIKQAVDEMNYRKNVMKKKRERLKEFLKCQMIEIKNTKIESPYFKIRVRKNAPKLILDEAVVPKKYKYEEVTEVIDKKLIKDELKEGKTFDFARLEQGTSLQIK